MAKRKPKMTEAEQAEALKRESQKQADRVADADAAVDEAIRRSIDLHGA